MKARSLSACATSLGFASRSVRVINRLPALVVNVADASTASPVLLVAPGAVVNVMVVAEAGAANPAINPPAAII